MPEPLQRSMEFAVDAAYQAGRVTLRYFQVGVEPEWKSDRSPVTVADREAEARIRALIEHTYPDDGILGEEYGEKPGRSGRRWIIDPIDGTKSFVHGVPLYGVLIALEVEGEVTVGVVHLPGLGETVWAATGHGCWWNGRRAAVSSVGRLEDAAICFTSWTSFAAEERSREWEDLASRVRLVRGWGDCYGHVLVATGRVDAAFDPAMSPWDSGPLLPILTEAGGTFTDWDGNETIHGPDAFSTNGHLYDSIMRCLEA